MTPSSKQNGTVELRTPEEGWKAETVEPWSLLSFLEGPAAARINRAILSVLKRGCSDPDTHVIDIEQHLKTVLYDRPAQHIENPTAYLTRIAKNAASTHLHECIRHQHLPLEAELLPAIDGIGIMEAIERMELIFKQARDISPDFAKILKLRLDGYKWPEIAEGMNVSVDNVRKMNQRFVARLRNQLKANR